MSNPEIQQKALDALLTLNTAIKNLRLYPPSSAMIVNTIDKLDQAFREMFAEEASLIFAESERVLLVCGEALPQKDQERPQVAAFLDLLLRFGVRSVSFEKGMSREELTIFLELMGMKPEKVSNEGGLQALISEKEVAHILLNEKVYIAKDKNHEIIAGLDVRDDQIVQYLAASSPESDINLDNVREMAKDANWIGQIFQSGMTQIMRHKGVVANVVLSENMVRMIGILDKVADRADQDRIAHLIGKSISDMDPEMINLILVQKIDDLFGGKLFQHVVGQIDDKKFEAVARQMNPQGRPPECEAPSAPAGTAATDVTDAYCRIMNTDRGRQVQQKMEVVYEREEREKVRQGNRTHEQVRRAIEGDDSLLLDDALMASLPDLIQQLPDGDEQATASMLIEKVVAGLVSLNPEVRAKAPAVLVGVISGYPVERRMELIDGVRERLMNWVRREESASRDYEKICHWLKNLIQDDIQRGRFATTFPLLKVFHQINGGALEKNDTIQTIASDIIGDLASEKTLELLFDELNTNAQNRQMDAGRILVRLGDVPMNQLLDMLRETDDSNERVRILQLIGEIGSMAVPLVRGRIREDEPWYYLRNLAYLLGRIGTEATVTALEPLLLHKHNRVRQEALKSLQRSGGNERGPLLLSVLPLADEPFKINIVEVLGTLKYTGAVNPLLNMLKDKPLVTAATRVDLEEKICTALGNIGVPEAVPLLTAISRSKGFLSVRTYAEKVRNAAEKALAVIKRKQAEAERVKGKP
jgi:HEAT repeat protein